MSIILVNPALTSLLIKTLISVLTYSTAKEI